MTTLDFLRRQFAYDSWANQQELRALSSLSAPPEQAVKLLNHIIGAQWVWFDRLEKTSQRMPVWPQESLDHCQQQLQELERAWQLYFSGLAEDDLFRACSYVNSKGDAFTSSTLDILTQLILHAAHHRGQISLEVRRSGNAPLPVDYIHAVRTGAIG